MHSTTLSTAAQDLIATYGNTAKNVINACRWGHERAASYIETTWTTAVKRAGTRISKEVRTNALSAQKKLTGYYVQGVTLSTKRADSAVDKVVALAGKGLEHAAANASRFEQATGVQTLHTVACASVPAVVAVHKFAVQLEVKSGEFAARIAGATAKKPVKASATRTKRTAVSTVRKTTPRMRKAIAAPEAASAA